ncbi:MAG: hypothetical protein ACP5HG_10765, partial [Anaerolineae bacterium]
MTTSENQNAPSIAALLFASANASVHFALGCLEPVPDTSEGATARSRLRAKSTFVDPAGRIMRWHDFGDLEGPGWAANAVGGAHLLYRWGRYIGDLDIRDNALRLVDHVLHDGFVCPDGFVWPYFDLAEERFCLNYAHTDAWLCPGSMAKIGVQMLDMADTLGEDPDQAARVRRLRGAAVGLADWLADHVPLLPSGWVPRRITRSGELYPYTPEGAPDPIADHSADGLFLLALWTRLGREALALPLGEAFIDHGGFWGSINHDTYDDHENVAYAVAFRELRRGADAFARPAWRDFAYAVALPAMREFRMDRDEHGVVTRGLFWMERSWDTAYLWENAEVAQAHLEAWLERGGERAREAALAILEAIAHHHYGTKGFLTEGVDWNNHVSQRHHVDSGYYGAIRFTEPLLNNLHLVGPTLCYLQAYDRAPRDPALSASLASLAKLPQASPDVIELRSRPMRYLLRLYYPAIETDDGVDAALRFVAEAGIDEVMLFEASYDRDPALLSLEVLKARFARLKSLVPRFREAGLTVHINVMITLGHTDHGGGHPEDFDVQFMVDAEGHVSASTACPLDPAFLDYVENIYRMAGACGADAVWVDDDVRFLGHDVPAMTCFCPLHLAAMRDRTGRAWTRAALVAALADDGAPPSLREAWFDLQASAISELASRVERAVHGDIVEESARPQVSRDSADSFQAIGLMTVETETHNAEGRRADRLLRRLTGSGGGPMIRPGAGFWHDAAPADVLAKTESVARQVGYLGDDVRVVAEIENHPYSPFLKSRRLMALEMALNVLAGTHDLSLNLFSGMMPFGGGDLDLASFLQGQRPFLRALSLARAGKRRLGIGVEAREDVPRQMRLGGRSLMAWIEPRPWELALARFGFPVGSPYDAPHLFAGDVVYADRYALGSAFQDGVILTPIAVRGLLAQGWGSRLGIRAVRPAPPDVNEVLTIEPLNGAAAGTSLPVRHYAAELHPYTFELDGMRGARILSEWVDLAGRPQGPAVMALELANGARVGVLPFEIREATPSLFQLARRA